MSALLLIPRIIFALVIVTIAGLVRLLLVNEVA